MKNKYQIWTKRSSIINPENDGIPELWIECTSMAQVGRILGLSVSQVRERMSWSPNGKLGNVWHVKYGSFCYQILRSKTT